MRVLQIVQKPQRRGAEIFAAELNRWLRAQGHEASTVYLYSHMPVERLELVAGDVALGGNEHGRFERFAVDPFLFRSLRDVVRATEPDVIQLNGARSIKYGCLLKRVMRPQWNLIYRNIDSPAFWLRGKFKRHVYRRVFMSEVDAVIGVSQRTLNEAVDLYGLECPAVFVPNGVDFGKLTGGRTRAEVRRSLGVADDAAVGVLIGSISRQKRPDRFVDLVEAVRRRVPGFVGWMLGDGPERAAVTAEVERRGLAGMIRFLGSQRSVGEFVSAADIHIFTSDTEGIPAAAAESAFLGVPIVSFAVGGMGETVVDGKTGILVSPGNLAGLTDAVVRLAQSASQRHAMGAAAHDWASSRFSMDLVGLEYERIYRSVHFVNEFDASCDRDLCARRRGPAGLETR